MAVIKRIARFLFVGSITTLLGLLFVTAFVLVMGRMLFAAAPQYHQEVEQWLSHALGQSLSVGRLQSDWRGWTPVLRLHNVSLLDEKGRLQLRFREMQVEVDLSALYSAGRLELGAIRLVGAKLSLLRQPDGRITLASLDGMSWEDKPALLPDWLVAVRRVGIVSSEVSWRDLRWGGPLLRLYDVNLHLQTDGSHHRLKGSVTLPYSLGQRLEWAADLRGPWGAPETWHGKGYLKAVGLRPEGWEKHWSTGNLRVPNGRMDLEFWGQWAANRLEYLDGIVWGSDLQLVRGASNSSDRNDPVNIHELRGLVRWQNKAGGWDLAVDRLSLRLDGTLWPDLRLRVARESVPDLDPWIRVGLNYLRLDELSQAVARLTSPDSFWTQALAGLRPRGEVRDLWLRAEPERQRLTVDARIVGLTTQAWNKIPAVRGLSGHVQGDEREGILELDDDGMTVDVPYWFTEPFQLDIVRGRVHWRHDEKGWSLASDELMAANDDIRSRTRFALSFPADDSSPFLDLQSAFEGPTAVRVPTYVPQRRFKPKLNAWLNQAFRTGRVQAGQALYYGRFEDHPFTQGNGIFELRLDVAGASLNYKEGWPAAEALDAQVVLRNGGLDIAAHDGRIFDSRVRKIRAAIANLRNPELRLTGQAKGPTANLLRYLRESPLSQRFGRFVETTRAQGDSTLDLDLRMPLVKGARPQVNGDVTFQSSALEWSKLGLALTELEGPVRFSDRGLLCEGIQARLLDRPVRLDIATELSERRRATSLTRVRALGSIDVATLKRHYPSPLLDYLKGETDWKLVLDIPGGVGVKDAPIELQFESDLHGLAVNLPQPVGKTAPEQRPLIVQAQLTSEPNKGVRFHYDQRIHGDLLLASAGGRLRPERLAVRFGAGEVKSPSQPGVHLSGGLERFVLAPWLAIARGGSGKQQIAGGQRAAPLSLATIDMRFGLFDAFAQKFSDTAVKLARQGSALKGRVDGPELKGTLRVPLGKDPLVPLEMNLDHLLLTRGKKQEPDEGQKSANAMNPRAIPPLRIMAKQLKFGAIDLGQMLLETARTPQGQRLEQLSLRSDAFEISAQGTWEVATGAQSCRLRIELGSNSLSKMLHRFNFASNIKKAKTKINTDIRWPGSLREFSLERMLGNLQIKIGKGRFLDLEPGVGRVFGLLSLETVLRRVSLDFSDLFRKGYSFDRIEGKFSLDGGNAYIHRLEMDAPSSQLNFTGRIGLVDQDYDQAVTVIPKVTASLPLAGAIAGGPTGAALVGALFIAQRVLGKEIDKMGKFQYTIAGPWDKPVITRLDKGVLSPLKRVLPGPNPGQGEALNVWEKDE